MLSDAYWQTDSGSWVQVMWKETKVTTDEKDLRIIMHNNLKPSRQWSEADKNANIILGMIKRTIVSREND